MKKKWHLVQVDIVMTAGDPLSRDFATSGVNYVEFLAKCSYDTSKSDYSACWWVKWRFFTTLPNGDIDLKPIALSFVLTVQSIWPNSPRLVTLSTYLILQCICWDGLSSFSQILLSAPLELASRCMIAPPPSHMATAA